MSVRQEVIDGGFAGAIVVRHSVISDFIKLISLSAYSSTAASSISAPRRASRGTFADFPPRIRFGSREKGRASGQPVFPTLARDWG